MAILLRRIGLVLSQPVQASAPTPSTATTPAIAGSSSASTISSLQKVQNSGITSFFTHLIKGPELPPYEKAIKALEKDIVKNTRKDGPGDISEQIKYLAGVMKTEVYTHCLDAVDLLLRDNSYATLDEKIDNHFDRIVLKIRTDIDPEDKKLTPEQRTNLTHLLECAFVQKAAQVLGEGLRGQLDSSESLKKIPETVEKLRNKIIKESSTVVELLECSNIFDATIEKYMWNTVFRSPEEVLQEMERPSSELIRFAQSKGLCDALCYEVSKKILFDEVRSSGSAEVKKALFLVSNLGKIYDMIAVAPRSEEVRQKVIATPPPKPIIIPTLVPVATTASEAAKKETKEEKKKDISPKAQKDSFSFSSRAAIPRVEMPRPAEAKKSVELKLSDSPYWFYEIPLELRGVIYQNILEGRINPGSVESRVQAHFIQTEKPTTNTEAVAGLTRRMQEADREFADAKQKLKVPANEIIFGSRLKRKEEADVKKLAGEFVNIAKNSPLFKLDRFYFFIYEFATKNGMAINEERWGEIHALDDMEIFVDALEKYSLTYLN